MTTKILRLVAVTLFAVLALGTTASAHNVFVSADPGKDATVQTSPKRVSVTFNQPVQEGPNEMTVTGPDGHSRWQQTTKAEVAGNTVSVPLRELGPAGQYTIGYRIISADGHPLPGSVSFTLAKAGNGTPAPAEQDAAPEQNDGGGVPVWVWIVGAVVLLGGGVFAALKLGKPREQ